MNCLNVLCFVVTALKTKIYYIYNSVIVFEAKIYTLYVFADARTSCTNDAFEIGITRIGDILFTKFRQDNRRNSIEINNLNIDMIKIEYNLKSGQVRNLPCLFKGIMEKMIENDCFADILPGDYKGFALGT